MNIDEAMTRWRERMFLARDQMLADPTTARGWQREVVREMEAALREDGEARARIEPALLQARSTLRHTEIECELWLMQSLWRSRQLHLHELDLMQRPIDDIRRANETPD